MEKVGVIDLDNTITIEDSRFSYERKLVNKEMVEALENFKKLGGNIEVFTARNMKSLNGDLDKIHQITKPIAESWLARESVPYDRIKFGKTYCGEDGCYVDDKSCSPEEFIFKYAGPYYDTTIDIVVPFYNEEENVEGVYSDLKRLERLFSIQKYIFIDNGSTDSTRERLNELVHRDNKISVICVNSNSGYGNGIKKGLKEVTSDYFILTHSDLQFDVFSYFLSIKSHLSELTTPTSVISNRLGRSIKSRLTTLVLRILLSIKRLRKVCEFNGQPKLIKLVDVGDIDTLPDGFALDYVLVQRLGQNKLSYGIVERPRMNGVSSWNGKNLFRKLLILREYLTAKV